MLLKVKKSEVANTLMKKYNFKFVASDVEDAIYIEPPENISNSQARKLLSSHIKLSLALGDLFKAKEKYNKVATEINKIALEINKIVPE